MRINTLFWNARGIAKKSAFSRLKIMCRQYNLQVVALCELKVNVSKFQSICLKLGFDHWLHNDEGRICVFFNREFSGSIISQSEQCLAIKFSHQGISSDLVAAFIHASSSSNDRKLLWTFCSQILSSGLPCIFYGDYNVILSSQEKKGGRPFDIAESRDFMNFIADEGLTDIGYTGSPFTWCNNRVGEARISKRLDRVLVYLPTGIYLNFNHLSPI